MATKKERIKTMSEQLEPVAPSVEFVKHAGDTSGKTADYGAYIQDLEDRRNRPVHYRPAKREVNLIEELDAALVNLEAGATDFEQSYGKPNLPLIEARNEVERLRSELSAAEARLAEIEARGDSVTRLFRYVAYAEAALNGLLSAAEEKAIRKLVTAKFGWEAPIHKVTRETLKELALDISVQSLRQFAIQPHREKTSDVAVLQQRLEAVGNKLADLRQHILGERSQHDTSPKQ